MPEIPSFIGPQPEWMHFVKHETANKVDYYIGNESYSIIDGDDIIFSFVKDSLLYPLMDSTNSSGQWRQGNLFRSYKISNGTLNWELDRVSPYDTEFEEIYYEPWISNDDIVFAGKKVVKHVDSLTVYQQWEHQRGTKLFYSSLKIDKLSGELNEVAYSLDTLMGIQPTSIHPSFNGADFLNVHPSSNYAPDNNTSYYYCLPLAMDMEVDSAKALEFEVNYSGDHTFSNILPRTYNKEGKYVFGRRFYDVIDNKAEYNDFIINILDLKDLYDIKSLEIDISDYTFDPNPLYPVSGFIYVENHIVVLTYNYEDGDQFWSWLWLTDDGEIKALLRDVVIDEHKYNYLSTISLREDKGYFLGNRETDDIWYFDIIEVSTDDVSYKLSGSFSIGEKGLHNTFGTYDSATNTVVFSSSPDREYNIVYAFDGADLGIEPIVTKTEDIPQLSFDIYPNPTQGKLQISGIDHFDGALSVSDVSGKELYRKSIVFSGSYDFDLSGLPGGTYVIQLHEKDRKYKAMKILHVK